jgi:hypothetical protein
MIIELLAWPRARLEDGASEFPDGVSSGDKKMNEVPRQDQKDRQGMLPKKKLWSGLALSITGIVISLFVILMIQKGGRHFEEVRNERTVGLGGQDER